MARCLNCVHFDVCDGDRHEYERMYGQCSDFLHEDDVATRAEVEQLAREVDRLSQVVMYHNCITEMEVLEAIERFAKNLEEKILLIPQHHFTMAEVLFVLNKLVKEMTGDK